jgi:hypothetical protein
MGDPAMHRVVVDTAAAEPDQELGPVGRVGCDGPDEGRLPHTTVGHGAPQGGPYERVGEVVHGPDNTPTRRRVTEITMRRNFSLLPGSPHRMTQLEERR